jgi:hypothetical protein
MKNKEKAFSLWLFFHFGKGRLKVSTISFPFSRENIKKVKVQPVVTTDTIDNFINQDRQIQLNLRYVVQGRILSVSKDIEMAIFYERFTKSY